MWALELVGEVEKFLSNGLNSLEQSPFIRDSSGPLPFATQ